MIYDAQKYPPYSVAWKNRIAAHEWGHAMNLEDHSNGDCDGNTIMNKAFASSPPPPEPPCDAPTIEDICGAWTTYNYTSDFDLDGTRDGCDIDADEDGCANFEEIGYPVNEGGDRNPRYYWDFYDINSDNFIDDADFAIIQAHYGHGPNDDSWDNLIDRYAPDSSKPWRTAEDNNGVSLQELLLWQSSNGHFCARLAFP